MHAAADHQPIVLQSSELTEQYGIHLSDTECRVIDGFYSRLVEAGGVLLNGVSETVMYLDDQHCLHEIGVIAEDGAVRLAEQEQTIPLSDKGAQRFMAYIRRSASHAEAVPVGLVDYIASDYQEGTDYRAKAEHVLVEQFNRKLMTTTSLASEKVDNILLLPEGSSQDHRVARLSVPSVVYKKATSLVSVYNPDAVEGIDSELTKLCEVCNTPRYQRPSDRDKTLPVSQELRVSLADLNDSESPLHMDTDPLVVGALKELQHRVHSYSA